MGGNQDQERESQITQVDFKNNADIAGDVIGGNQQNTTHNTTNNYYFQSSDPSEVIPFAPAVQGKSARKGLEALADLIANTKVRDVVITFQTEFRASCEQIEILSAYKNWHDELHKLEFQCYRVIESPIERLLRDIQDDLAIEELENHIWSLQQIIKQIEQIAAESCLISSINSQIKDLKAIESDLNSGLERCDCKRLKKAKRSLYRILGTPRSRVNDYLIATAQALRLPALVGAITHIRDSIQNNLLDQNLDQDKLSAFQSGALDLEQLEKSLAWQIQTHDRWQEIDIELHRIEGDIEGDLEELELSWKDIRGMIEGQLDALDEAKVASFCKNAERLEQALQTQNPAKISRYFRLIRRDASQHFDWIDANLKRLCTELRRVGEPLNSVLELLQ